MISNVEYISCSCGKQCKGLRGLKAHQRLCRIMKSVSANFVDNVENDYKELNYDNNFDIDDHKNLLVYITNESSSLKNGVKISTSKW